MSGHALGVTLTAGVAQPVTRAGLKASPKIRMNSPVPIHHHFTVDVEEHFQVAAFEQHVPRAQWDALPSRVDRGVRLLLELLAEHNAHGTFFILSWVAERQPGLVRQIAEAGHEIASHGTDHVRVTQLSRDAFRQSIADSKAILEDVSGHAVVGYRAPSFSITRDVEWALDVLIESGYRYDSSLYPVRRDGYGFAGGERDPHLLRRAAGTLHEFPPATVQWGSAVLPAGGGAYFRHLPYTLVRTALSDAERRGVPATFYIHPWELDPEQPRVSVPYPTHLRHYGGLTRTVPRLRKLLATFQFQSIARTLAVAERRRALGQSGESLALADDR
jgi:polysaccharide deacetylase family protein (PEP-CTERM system associated)